MFNHQFRQSLGQMECSIQALYDGIKSDTMFGNVNADVPVDEDPTRRVNAQVSGRYARSVNLAKASVQL